MTEYLISIGLIRIVLPLALLLSICLRPFGFSILYLLLYFLIPFIPPIRKTPRAGCHEKMLILYMLVPLSLLFCHGLWHSFLGYKKPYGNVLEEYPLIRRIGINLGLLSYSEVTALKAIQILAPEIVMMTSSMIIFACVNKLLTKYMQERRDSHGSHRYFFIKQFGKFLSLFLIMFCGILKPSVTSGIYFLVFICIATSWSLGVDMNRVYAVTSRCLMGIMAIHMFGLMVYQSTWVIELFPPDMNFPRYFGAVQLVNITETNPMFTYATTELYTATTTASPLVILLTYYMLGFMGNEILKPKQLRRTTVTKKWSQTTLSKLRLRQTSSGSILMDDEDSQLRRNVWDDVGEAITDFFKVLVRSSYIATTITMMAWSILFHSWLAFVFLMWANVVWLCHNQRAFMLKTSPILVVYSIILLFIQYLYSMNLTESELPSHVKSVNLNQIGMGKTPDDPAITLLIKTVFTCMFWATLRQHIQEKRSRRSLRAHVATEMATPLQRTVSTATSPLETADSEHKSKIIRKLGEFLRYFCARFWIYVVVIMLFVIGISGERMTIFRIIYMFLFLIFILMFQCSWYWWRKLMYVFWLTVIMYSMINLILLYVYQFDNFPKIIENYLLISEALQRDLGLEPYKRAHLFVKLLTPTCFLIITIMQVHYFHKDFMALSEKKTTLESTDNANDLSQAGASTIKDDIPQLPLEENEPSTSRHKSTSGSPDSRHKTKTKSEKKLKRSKSRETSIFDIENKSKLFHLSPAELYVYLQKLIDNIFIFLDIHLIKIIFVALTLLCVLNVCALHIPIIVIMAPVIFVSARKQRFCILFISTLINIYLLTQMVYQFGYIDHSTFDVVCTSSQINRTLKYNNAEWVGFHKSSKHMPLAVSLKGYIALTALFIFYSLVIYRQEHIRKLQESTRTEKVMFPNITREKADLNLICCVKYLINYGFYKFGVEITLICLVSVIGSRMDVYAVYLSVWLLIFVSSGRQKISQMWPVFTVSITILLPIQYMIAVGFVPEFCIEYPWSGDNDQMKHIRSWFFLPYNESPPHASKLIFDFFLLLFASRQLRVFNLEKQAGDAYPGGSNNENIGENWETPGFVNPVPDFLSAVNNWLDVIKRIIFLGMLWVTLAIMFQAGTKRVNIFSMGYLIGSFIFLWQGSDFYLRPKSAILYWWSWLLRYNVGVVLLKALLQVPGCLLGSHLHENACWIVQMFGIGCVDKFAGGNIASFIKMDYVKQATCLVPQNDIGLAWDGVCFAFLILQRRLFYSYYFLRVIDESKATTILSSRGADLMEKLRQNQIENQDIVEAKIIEKIILKMERIKANQQKSRGLMATTDLTKHDDDESNPVERRPVCTKKYKEHSTAIRKPDSHQKAVRSGDYYMFEEFDHTDDVVKEEELDSDDDSQDAGLVKLGISELLSTALKKDLQSAVDMRNHSIQSRLRQSSPGFSDKDKDRKREDSLFGASSRRVYLEDEEEEVDTEEYERDLGKESYFEKFLRYMNTGRTIVNSIIVSITRRILKLSRDYRYVSKMLFTEKKKLKERDDFGVGLREGSQMMWEPLPDMITKIDKADDYDENMDSMFNSTRSPFILLGYAIWYAIISHTDIACYIMVFINQVQSATILSIPLPLMVFLWGTLSIPRPTKTFWISMIAYTEGMVLVKSMFQFEMLPWNQKAVPENMPFNAPRIIGIEKKHDYALYDLLLLLIIFLHRFILKSLGLWKESTVYIELQDDKNYPLTTEDTQMIVTGRCKELGRKYVELHIKDQFKESSEMEQPENEMKEEQEASPINKSRTLSEHELNEPGTSKQAEDEHYNVTDEMQPIIGVTANIEKPSKHYPGIILLSLKGYMSPINDFFVRMISSGARVTTDMYAYMFLCDFFNFLVVIFGFAAFGTQQGDGGVQSYLEENKVPIPFLIMLILQFALIVIDRALYLRKFIVGKILFQYALVIGVHIWMFFVLPLITERKFNALAPPPLWYLVKCVYLLLSAYQIRCGYPRRIIGNFLCKSYGFINMLFFRGFMTVPFVFELRTLMDWIWTDSSMTLMDWLKMEDIFANVFLLKCSRNVEDEFPQPRGIKKSPTSKYLLGGCVLAFVIAIIWFPLVFFAFGNTVGQSNPPTDVTVKIRIGPFLPVYQMTAQSHNIDLFTEEDYSRLKNIYSRDRTAQTFLSNYMFNDVAVVTINPTSSMTWDISPPELDRLKAEAASNSSLSIKISYVITHLTNSAQNPPTIDDFREVNLDAFVQGEPNPERAVLLQLLNGTAPSDVWLHVKAIFPKFVKIFNKGIAKPAHQLMPLVLNKDDDPLYRDVQLRLERKANHSGMYWLVKERCGKRDPLLTIPKNTCNMLVMYTFNDKLFPETLNFISGSGIIGLYTTFVFLASRVLRGFFSGIYTRIMFDDLPNVDRVLQLCLDVYLVREAVELALEEDLFAKLVFLYRSPETMIKWSRPAEEPQPLALPPADE